MSPLSIVLLIAQKEKIAQHSTVTYKDQRATV